MCNIRDIVATHRHLKVLGGTMQMECLQFQGKETWQINFMGNHQNETWWLPAFCNSGKAGMYQHSQSEGAAWRRR